MFRRLKNLCYRFVFQHLTLRAVIGALVVYSLLKGLKHGVIYYQNFERFYVKVGLILYINICGRSGAEVGLVTGLGSGLIN